MIRLDPVTLLADVFVDGGERLCLVRFVQKGRRKGQAEVWPVAGYKRKRKRVFHVEPTSVRNLRVVGKRVLPAIRRLLTKDNGKG